MSRPAGWKLWILVGVVLATLGAGYHYFFLHRPVGNGPAAPSVPREIFSKPWTTRPTVMLGLGDSVTAGFGATPGHSYFQLLVANPPDEFPDMHGINLAVVLSNLKATNLAASGSTSLDHVKMQIDRLPAFASNTLGLAVITTGGNDIIHNYGRTPPREGAMYGATLAQAQPWIKSFEQRLEKMIQRIQERFPGGCHIFLANIYDPTDGAGDAEHAGLPAWKDGLAIIQAYNDVIGRCCEKNPSVHLVNVHDAFLGHGIHCTKFWRKNYRSADPHYWYHENLEDPNNRGYDALRRLFLLEMAKAFLRPR